MRRLSLLAFGSLLVMALLIVSSDGAAPALAAVNKNVHVHDDFYHPAGAFVVGPGTDHNLAQAACQKANPDAACDATIHVGDTITWVSPAPLAANVHTVTECTDNSFSVCGANVDPINPIDNSGLRAPPNPGPSGWPYGPVAFNVVGTYYYRCEVHPAVMRGRIVVTQGPVGGEVEIAAQRGGDASASESGSSSGGYALIAAAGAAVAIALAAAGWYARRRLVRE
jgi:plastocyanin